MKINDENVNSILFDIQNEPSWIIDENKFLTFQNILLKVEFRTRIFIQITK
jgi:hypothetical protein